MKNSGKLLFFLTLLISSMPFGCQTISVREESPKEKAVVEESKEKPIIVAVVDTGFDFNSDWKNASQINSKIKKPKLCKMGHKDFTGTGIQDNYGHGTHIAGLIGQYAGDANYCIVIIKFFDTATTNNDNLSSTAKAFQRAVDLKVDIINYSGGGMERSQEECSILKKALDLGIKVVVAAGNESKDINKFPYYPAMCDSRLMAVANVTDNGVLAESSNYSNDIELTSRGLYKEHGTRVLSIIPNNGMGYMTGTSQATAIKTGKIVRDWEKQ